LNRDAAHKGKKKKETGKIHYAFGAARTVQKHRKAWKRERKKERKREREEGGEKRKAECIEREGEAPRIHLCSLLDEKCYSLRKNERRR